jgi:hypothetical protein
MSEETLAGYLAEVRLRSRKVSTNGGPGPGRAERRHRWNEHSARDVPRLLAAVQAALACTTKLEPQGAASSALEEDRMWIRQECADMIREAISAALLKQSEPRAASPETTTPPQ